MTAFLKLICLFVLSVGMLAIISSEVPAATSSTLDILSTDRVGDTSDTVDVGRVTPIAKPTRETARPLPSGNPLWSIPLSVLSATQERPIFSASRRPPQQAVAAPVGEAVAAPVRATEPDRLQLLLMGAVVGEGEAIAIFLDQTNQKIVRLRQGDTHAGWNLGSVQGREVTFKKADRSEILVLRAPDRTAGAPAAAGGEAAMPISQPVSGALDGSYAPFVPRSTPKNGESDGL